MHVVRAGTGPPVLLLHSSGLSSGQWRRLIEDLARDHAVVAPDLIGYGRTPWDGRPFHLDQDLDLVVSLVRELGLPHVIGHSYGGFLALHAALRAPVASVVAYEPVVIGVLAEAGDTPDDGFFSLDDGMEAFMRRFVGFWMGEGGWDRLPERARADMLASADKLHQEVRALSEDRTPGSAYAAIEAPVLVMWGSRTQPDAIRMCRGVANAGTAAIEGAGHMGPITHSDAVNARIRAFLQSRT